MTIGLTVVPCILLHGRLANVIAQHRQNSRFVASFPCVLPYAPEQHGESDYLLAKDSEVNLFLFQLCLTICTTHETTYFELEFFKS